MTTRRRTLRPAFPSRQLRSAIYLYARWPEVPVCIVEAKRDEFSPAVPESELSSLTFPSVFAGGGYPVIADVQGQEHIASIGCVVTDGHLAYALTNRHVAGALGEPVYH